MINLEGPKDKVIEFSGSTINPAEQEAASIETDVNIKLPGGFEIKLNNLDNKHEVQQKVDSLMREIVLAFNGQSEIDASSWIKVLQNVSQIYEMQNMSKDQLNIEGIVSILSLHQLQQNKLAQGHAIDEDQSRMLDASIVAHNNNLNHLRQHVNLEDLTNILKASKIKTDALDSETKKAIQDMLKDSDDDGYFDYEDENNDKDPWTNFADSANNNNFAVDSKASNTEEILVDETFIDKLDNYFRGNDEVLDLTSSHQLKPIRIGRMANSEYKLVLWVGHNESTPEKAFIIEDYLIIQDILRDRFEDLRYQAIVKLENLPSDNKVSANNEENLKAA